MHNKPQATSPGEVLRDESQLRALRFLWKSRAEWSGREVSRQTGLSAPACHAALKRLYARGLVLFRHVSHVHLYRINPENYLAKNLFGAFFEAEAALPEKFAALVKDILRPGEESGILSLVLFGSMARGTQRLGSDLDLLVVVASEEDIRKLEPRIEELRRLLFERFSTPFSPYIQTLRELRRKAKGRLPLIGRIIKEGKTFYGSGIQELVS